MDREESGLRIHASGPASTGLIRGGEEGGDTTVRALHLLST